MEYIAGPSAPTFFRPQKFSASSNRAFMNIRQHRGNGRMQTWGASSTATADAFWLGSQQVHGIFVWLFLVL